MLTSTHNDNGSLVRHKKRRRKSLLKFVMSIVSHDKTVWKQEVNLVCPVQTRISMLKSKQNKIKQTKKQLDVWETRSGHCLVDPYTWPWSPNGHGHGHDLLPPPLCNVNRPSHSEMQLFQNKTMKILGQGHVCGQRSRSRLTFIIQRSRL